MKADRVISWTKLSLKSEFDVWKTLALQLNSIFKKVEVVKKKSWWVFVVFTFILISVSLIRFHESEQDLIGSPLLNKRETSSK